MALSRTSRGDDYDLVANALTVGAFTPADGALLVAVHFRFRSGTSTPGSALSGGGLTWTQRVNHLHASSLDWDPAVAIWTAPVTTGASMTVTATTSTATHRHGLYVLEYGGAGGVGVTGTAGFSGATGDLSITLSGTPAADSEVIAAILGRNWVGTASAVGVAVNGTELHRKVSASGSEVDELYTVVQAITGMSGASQVFWEDTDMNNSNGNQGTATVALEITAAVEDEPITGAMAAQESGSDTFAGAGSVLVSGGMAAAETGADALSGAGATVVSGTMAAAEAGPDGFVGAGSVAVSGAMAAAETGADTFAGSGSLGAPGITGTMAAIEVGADIAAIVGSVLVRGAMAAQETGSDIFVGIPIMVNVIAPPAGRTVAVAEAQRTVAVALARRTVAVETMGRSVNAGGS